MSESKQAKVETQYKASKDLLQAFHVYITKKVEHIEGVLEESTSPEELFKALGQRRAYREFLKLLPESERGINAQESE